MFCFKMKKDCHARGLFMSLFLLALAATSSAQLINSFESANDLTKPNLVPSYSTVSQTTNGVTDGNSALNVTFSNTVGYPEIGFPTRGNVNVAASGGIGLDVKNPGSTDISINVYIQDGANNQMAAEYKIPAGASVPLRISNSATVNPQAYGVQALPNPFAGLTTIKVYGPANFNMANVVKVGIFLRRPTSVQSLIVDNVRLLPAFDLTSYLNGWVDQYGQNAKVNYNGKVTSDAGLADGVLTTKASTAVDGFGGWLTTGQQTPSPYFKTAFVNGKWWLVDPNGNLFFSSGMVAVRYNYNHTVIANRGYMFASLPSQTGPYAAHYATLPTRTGNQLCYNFYGANLQKKYGANYASTFRSVATARLKGWGFNTLGVSSDFGFVNNTTMPYVLDLWTAPNNGITYNHVSTGVDYWGPLPDPYDPNFRKAFVTQSSWPTSLAKKDPYLIGYTVDNELSWTGTGNYPELGIAKGTLAQSSATSPAKMALVAKFTNQYGNIALLNAAWGTSFASWSDLGSAYTMPATLNTTMQADLHSFCQDYANQYFSTIATSLKTMDPNHLYLGGRLTNQATNEVIKACANYADVMSINYYQDAVDSRMGTILSQGKPVLITEYHFGATDHGNPFGGLQPMPNQASRGTAYAKFVTSALANPNIVGCHWFTYLDQPITGRFEDGQNGGIGFVDIADKPMTELVAAASNFNFNLYGIRYNQ